MVAMTRAHIADPELVAKLARGEEERVRPCVGATHCMSPLRPTCIHNPSTGHEAGLPHAIERAGKKRRVLVAGGGPAGLEAARVCAERGHDVRLCEASERLGGQVLMAARASWRSQLTGIVEWRARELERLGVEVSLSSRVEPDSVGAERADVVIVATGGVPDLDWIEGAAHCTSVWDVLTGKVSADEDSIVYDGTGRHAALTAAEAIRQAGGEVAFFGLDGHLAMEMSYAEQVVWRRRTYEIGIEPRLDRRLERVAREGNRLRVTFRNELRTRRRSTKPAGSWSSTGPAPPTPSFTASWIAPRTGAPSISRLCSRARRSRRRRMMASGFSASATRSPAATYTPRCSTRSACAAPCRVRRE